MDDVNRRTLSWGREGQVNPFKEVYDVRRLKPWYTYVICSRRPISARFPNDYSNGHMQ